MKYLVFLIFLISFSNLSAQVHEVDKLNCRIDCDPEIHKENANYIYEQMQNDSVLQAIANSDTIRFPLSFVFVSEESSINKEDSLHIHSVLQGLNRAFQNTKFVFYEHEIVLLRSALKIEDLSRNENNRYITFSQQHDKKDMITLYILDHKKDFCDVTETTVSCSRTGGFSFILSSLTNNIVISQFDLRDPKIVAHEFGHFFGLYHTFEEGLYGKDDFNHERCYLTGDRICDTPPDPGTIFEIYVNYSICEMEGFIDTLGNEYKPLIENYMSYYKPCYLREYTFTPQQEFAMKIAATLHIRKKFSRP